MIYTQQKQSATYQASQPSEPSQPTNGKPARGLARPVRGQPQQQNLASVLSSPQARVESAAQTPLQAAVSGPRFSDLGNPEAARLRMESSIDNNPARQQALATGPAQRATLQGIIGRQQQANQNQLGYAAGRQMEPQINPAFNAALGPITDRIRNANNYQSGVVGSDNGRQFSGGSSAYAGGDIALGYRRPNPITPERQARMDANAARMDADPQVQEQRERTRALVAQYGPRGMDEYQQAKWDAHQERKAQRLADVMPLRQQRALAQQQQLADERNQRIAMQNGGQMSPLMATLMQRRPEVAASIMNAQMQNQSQLAQLMFQSQRDAQLANDRNAIERERIAAQERALNFQTPLQRAQAEEALANAEEARAKREVINDPVNRERLTLLNERDALVNSPDYVTNQTARDRVKSIDERLGSIGQPTSQQGSQNAQESVPKVTTRIEPDSTGNVPDEQIDGLMRELHTNGLTGQALADEMIRRGVSKERLMRFAEENGYGAGTWLGYWASYLFSIPGNYSSEDRRIERKNAPILSLQEALGI